MANVDTFRCEVCERAFVRKAWMRPRFCSVACRGAARRVRDYLSTCQACGKEFRSRTGRNRTNRWCSLSCGARSRAVTSPDKTGRGRARAMYPLEPCEVCGKTGRGRGTIDRHHRNSDRLDNSPENIAFLCRLHHLAAHRISDGKVGGGPRPRVAAESRERAKARTAAALELRAAGKSTAEIAEALSVHASSVSRWFRKYPDVAA